MKVIAQKTGAALLTVLIAMMIISLMLFEFQYSSMIERKLAYNDLNQLQAYYLSKAGARMGLLRIALYGRLRASKDIQGFKQKGFDVVPLLDQIWQLPLPAFPPTGEKNDKMLKADVDAQEKILKETKVSEGRVTHTITSESSKINLNYLQVSAKDQNGRVDFRSQPTTLFQYVGMLLVNVLENFLQQSENPTAEYDNMKPEDVVVNIMDWVSPGTTSMGGGAKDTFYETQKPPYKAKKGRFFTIEELKLVKGIDDHLYNKLKPLVTVYSYDGKINLNTAGKDVYKALYRDFSDDDVKRILTERQRRGGTWPDVKTFVDFVANDLNRTGFKTLYANEKEYPFAVGSLSFVIESLGQIDKSKSSIQKVIKVGVALMRGKGGQVTAETNPVACNGQDPVNSPTFWLYIQNKCVTKPTSASECQNLTGQWQEGPPKGCSIINISPGSQNTGATLIQVPQAGQGGQGTAEPNSMKIMFWSET